MDPNTFITELAKLVEIKEKEKFQRSFNSRFISDTSIKIKSVELRITRFKTIGDLECDIRFKPKMNLIITDNLKGKTVILRMIQYCFLADSKYKSKLKDTSRIVLEKTKIIYVEFSINNIHYTIKRPVKARKDSFLFEGTIEEILENKKTVKYVTKNLEIPNKVLSYFGWEPFQKHTASKRIEKGYSLQRLPTFYRVFYQDQQRGYTEFVQSVHTDRKNVLDQVLGYSLAELNNLVDVSQSITKTKKVELTRELKNLTKEINLFQSLQNGINEDNLDLQRLKIKNEEINEVIDEIKHEISILRKQNDQIGVIDPNLAQNMVELLNEMNQIDTSIRKLKRTKERLEEQIEAKKQRIKAYEFELILEKEFAPYYPTICPRCEQEIDKEKIKQEHQRGYCRICSKPARRAISKDRIEIIDQFQKNLVYLEKKVEPIVLELKVQEKKLEQKIELQKRKTQKLISYNQKLGILKNIESKTMMLATKIEIKAEISSVRLINLIDKRQNINNKLNGILQKQEKLKWANESIKIQKENILKSKLEDIENYILFLMNKSFPDIFLEEIKIKNYLPIITKGDISSAAEGMRARLYLCYHFALFKLSLLNKVKYPKFLIIDAPMQEEMMDKHIIPLLSTFYDEINQIKNEEGQLLIFTSARKQLSKKKLEHYRIEIPEGEFLFN